MFALPADYGGQIGLGRDASDPCILVIFSKHILAKLAKIRDAIGGGENLVIGLDGTFKINNLGWQLLVVGAHDYGHRVHTVAHIVMSHRSVDDYELVCHCHSVSLSLLMMNVLTKLHL